MLQLKEIDGELRVCFVGDDGSFHEIKNTLDDGLSVEYLGGGFWHLAAHFTWKDKGRS